jgi:signal transduction histidine kinase/CheY-like chemotaxis protein
MVALAYGLTVAAAAALIGGVVTFSTRKVLFDDVREYLAASATTGSSLIEGETHERLAQSPQPGTQEYELAVRPLRALLAANVSLQRVYSGVISGSDLVYVLDARAGSAGSQAPRATVGQRAPLPPIVRAMIAADSTVVEDSASARNGVLGVQAAAPLRARDGKLIGAVVVTLGLNRYNGWITNLDRVVLIGGAFGLVLALLSGFAAYKVERSRLDAERELKSSKATAEANARAKGEFLANMSHEIRTPLHGVLGMSEAMLASAHTEADRRSLEVINKSASSLLGILNDILDYSKLEAGRVELLNAPFDPRALVDDVTDLFAVKAEEKGLEIAVRETIRAERWPVGDSARLKQVLLNLVGNAVKFTEHGHVQIDLETVMIGRKTIALRLAVKDTGIGIAEETQGRLFEQFQQGEASTSRRFGGTGLGLAISRQLVVLMGGTLAVQSTEGLGTEFTVDLQLPVATTMREAPLTQGMIPGSRVLVACGLALTRQSIAEILARHGLVAETVVDHQAMVNRLRGSSQYAFVIADAPSIGDGSQPVLGGLREAPPLILLTSLHHPLSNSTLSSAGAAAQLRRPVREDHVMAALEDLVAGRLKTGGGVGRSPAPPSTPISDATLVAAARAAGAPVIPPAPVTAPVTPPVTPPVTAPPSPNGAPTTAAPVRSAPITPTPIDALRPDAMQDGKPRVLVVDDVELNLMVARAMIGSLGAHVVSANGGTQALELLGRDRYALVLMDCHMPEIDGYEVTRRVRAAGGVNGNTPIVALSASAFAEDRQRALESGMNDFAPKPIELNGLRSVLGRWIPGFQPSGPKAASSAT